ncbi:MAG: class I SAM-dependent methyltransferase [Desulfobulbaceae bacterium]|nr:class I SAM-dependent methyltransferase [Desulfobulbaceae bacterium]
MIISKYKNLLLHLRIPGQVRWRELAVAVHNCPVCDYRRVIVRMRNNPISVRCLTCRSTAVTMSLVGVLRRFVPELTEKKVYELSSRGPLVNFLKRNCKKLTCSEYLDGVKPGDFKDGVQCQDVQQLTFPDNSFDICTSTEVFEHVPDDLAGFAEIRRVLRPGGLFIFTVPVFPSPETIERARLDRKFEVRHLLPPQYHSDPIRGHKGVLVFRDYGRDIVKRLEKSGFREAQLIHPENRIPYGYGRPVILARKCT